MQREYADVYRELYDHHWWWRAREEWIVGALRGLGLTGRNAAILDVGCGDGLFFDRLREFGVAEGVEPDASLLRPGTAYRARIHARPFDETFRPGREYDVILMLDVLEHIPDAAGALKHVLALLAPGGTFVATVPAFQALWTSHDVINQHVMRYDRAAFLALANTVGMRVDSARYFFHWTAPIKLAAHLAERLGSGHSRARPARPPRVPPGAINQTLYHLTRLEQRLFRHAPLPFGSSLLIIGGRSD
ncbi:MAG: class I SAM-dependent methyltransferase [Gemmatimonadaceae bacterium]